MAEPRVEPLARPFGVDHAAHRVLDARVIRAVRREERVEVAGTREGAHLPRVRRDVDAAPAIRDHGEVVDVLGHELRVEVDREGDRGIVRDLVLGRERARRGDRRVIGEAPEVGLDLADVRARRRQLVLGISSEPGQRRDQLDAPVDADLRYGRGGGGGRPDSTGDAARDQQPGSHRAIVTGTRSHGRWCAGAHGKLRHDEEGGEARGARWLADGLAPWKREVLGSDPRAQPVLDQITDAAQLVIDRYHAVRMRRWHGDRVVLIGDAAHAMSPQLGNGANLALVDAMVLADTLAAAADPAAGLASYSRARLHHLRHYQRMTAWLTPLFQSSSSLAGWVRDRVMPLADRIGPTHRLMVRTMAGHERGLIRRSLALPAAAPPSGTGPT